MVVVVVKNIPHHRDVGRLFAVPPRGQRGGDTRGCIALVKAVKRVALDVRVHAVEVEPVIAAAKKLIVVHLQNRPGPLAAADV